MWELVFTSDARREYDALDPSVTRRINVALELLRLNPERHPNLKRLKGKFAGHSRFRAGDWRIIHYLRPALGRIVVTHIAHRSEVYE